MHKLHVFLVAALFAGAAVLGTTAVLRTTAHHTSDVAALQARTSQLDRFEAQLRAQLAKRPPALPPVPKTRPAGPATAPRVVYRRPPAVVVVRHTGHHGDDGHEAEGGGGDD